MKNKPSGSVFFARLICSCGLLFLLVSFNGTKSPAIYGDKNTRAPKIVNIVNFIRLLEPRDATITEDVLYQTVVKQIDIMKKYKLPGTFLLQYDALIDPRYQQLLKNLPRDSFEIGAWWEIPQPLVEKAGMKWRGRYPWDWHADVGFATGYTPDERKKLIDVYMADFKKVFGYYPRSVASWFIDAFSLNYMYEKYQIVASANCKDQYGTDGYTLWGGYWNQAYYPSKINSYMPAQHAEQQIPVPVFRMLGSDPIRQYDQGLGSARQGVVTLEPVYTFGGGDSTWVDWFFKTFTDDPSLGFNYTQAGQENSFTWDAMKKGFELQMPLIAKLREANKIRVETLEESARWFKKKYKVTPATSFSVSKDISGSDLKTIWFNSRFYRINILWENEAMRIRDIHLFDEEYPSIYETQVATSNECSFFTLPFVDGYLWSKPGQLAGLQLKAIIDGKEVNLTGKTPAFSSQEPGLVKIRWPLINVEGIVDIELREQNMQIKLQSAKKIDWFFKLNAADPSSVPYDSIQSKTIDCDFKGWKYKVTLASGFFSKDKDPKLIRINHSADRIVINFKLK